MNTVVKKGLMVLAASLFTVSIYAVPVSSTTSAAPVKGHHHMCHSCPKGVDVKSGKCKVISCCAAHHHCKAKAKAKAAKAPATAPAAAQ